MTTNATDKTTVTYDLPDFASDTIVWHLLTSVAINSAAEVILKKDYSVTLDANGVASDDLPTPDQTGDLAWLWRVHFPDGAEPEVTLAYNAAAQDISVIVAAEQSSTSASEITALIANKQDKDTSATDGNMAFFASGETIDAGFPMAWNADDNTIDVPLTANVTGQMFQEFFVYARNASGGDIDDGEIVKISGSTGARLTIELAQADSVANARQIGMATEDIANNASGFVTVAGLVRNQDMSAYSDGDVLYLSTATPGAITDTQPTWPAIAIEVGVVVRNHATLGTIFVGAYETGSGAYDKASDAQAAAEAASQPLNSNLTEISSITPAEGDLISQDGTWQAITPSAAPGAVADIILKSGTGGKLQLKLLGIGIDPLTPLHVFGANGEIRLQQSVADDANKFGRVTVANYDNDVATPVMLVLASSEAADNTLKWGGGSSIAYAATEQSFYAAADHTTTTGTAKMVIDVNGVGIGASPETFATAAATIKPLTNDKSALRVQGLAGQTGALIRIRDSGNTANIKIYDDGEIDAVSYTVGGAAGASGSFTTTDAKTVTVVNGIITAIV